MVDARLVKKQLRRYDGNAVLAAAAYNAGSERVDRWIRSIGDPRKGEISDTEWAAALPDKRLREYLVSGGGEGDTLIGRMQSDDVPPLPPRRPPPPPRPRPAPDEAADRPAPPTSDPQQAPARDERLPAAQRFNPAGHVVAPGYPVGEDADLRLNSDHHAGADPEPGSAAAQSDVSGSAPELESDEDFQRLDQEGRARVVEVGERSLAEMRAELQQDLQAEREHLRRGDEPEDGLISRDRIERLYGPDEARGFWEEQVREREIGAWLRQIRGMPEYRQQMLLQQVDDADEQSLSAAMVRDRELRAEDPVAYALRYDASLGEYFRIASESDNPADLARAVSGLLDTQRQLQIDAPQPMPDVLFDIFRRDWLRRDAEGRVQYLDQFVDALGDRTALGGVMQRLSRDPELSAALVIITMDQPSQRQAAIDLAGIADADIEQLRAGITRLREDDETLDYLHDVLLGSFFESMSFNEQEDQIRSVYATQTLRLFYLYAQNGGNLGEAAQAAADAVINSRYSYRSVNDQTIRVPMNRDATAIARGADLLLRSPDQMGTVSVRASVPRLTAEQLQDLYAARLADSGFWATLPNDSGLVLMIGTFDGAAVVRDQYGNAITVDWDELESRGRSEGERDGQLGDGGGATGAAASEQSGIGLQALGLGGVSGTSSRGIIRGPQGEFLVDLDVVRSPAGEAIWASIDESWDVNLAQLVLYRSQLNEAAADSLQRQEAQRDLEEILDAESLGLGYSRSEARPPSRLLSADEANRRFGLPGLVFREDVLEPVAERVAEIRLQQLLRQWVIGNAQGRWTEAGMLIGAIGASMADPFGLLLTRFPMASARKIGQIANRIGRIPARFLVGTGEGVAGTLVTEPIAWLVSDTPPLERTVDDSLNAILAAALAGGLADAAVDSVGNAIRQLAGRRRAGPANSSSILPHGGPSISSGVVVGPSAGRPSPSVQAPVPDNSGVSLGSRMDVDWPPPLSTEVAVDPTAAPPSPDVQIPLLEDPTVPRGPPTEVGGPPALSGEVDVVRPGPGASPSSGITASRQASPLDAQHVQQVDGGVIAVRTEGDTSMVSFIPEPTARSIEGGSASPLPARTFEVSHGLPPGQSRLIPVVAEDLAAIPEVFVTSPRYRIAVTDDLTASIWAFLRDGRTVIYITTAAPGRRSGNVQMAVMALRPSGSTNPN